MITAKKEMQDEIYEPTLEAEVPTPENLPTDKPKEAGFSIVAPKDNPFLRTEQSVEVNQGRQYRMECLRLASQGRNDATEIVKQADILFKFITGVTNE